MVSMEWGCQIGVYIADEFRYVFWVAYVFH